VSDHEQFVDPDRVEAVRTDDLAPPGGRRPPPPRSACREIARSIDNYNHRRHLSSCEMPPPVAYGALLAQRAAEAAEEDWAA
jgi:hypothetical protein